jgi:CHAD domain-containing protein
LKRWILGQRRKHERRLGRELDRARTRRVVRRASRWLKRRSNEVGPTPPDPAKALPRLVSHFVPQEAWTAYQAIVAFELRAPVRIEVIHKVRSSSRRLRYLLELFRGALPESVEDMIESLRVLQDRLGALHDHAVAIDRIERAWDLGEIPDSPALRVYLDDRRATRDTLQAEFAEEWRALTGTRFRFALSHLVSGEIAQEPAPEPIQLVPQPRERSVA